MKIQQTYDKYQIMPNLQEHMLRVAGVASIICDNYTKPIDKTSIVTVCLLHDMGNIIKSDLQKFPEFLKPKGLKYWQEVKNSFIKKYGNDDHAATFKIIQEITPNNTILEILNRLEFSDSLKIANSKNILKKIVKYSDLRVTPYGVDSLDNRLSEAKKRYVFEKGKWTEKEFDKIASVWKKIEKEIFTHCKIAPEDITQEKVNPIIKSLRNFKIKQA